MARIQHGDEMHRDAGGGGSGPFEQEASPNEHIWSLITGATTLADSASGDALLILDTGQAFLGGGVGADSTSLILDSAQVTLDAGAGTSGKHWLTGGVGIVIPVLSADPAGGDSENGQIYYNDSDEKFRVYENGAWADMVGSTGVADILDLPTAETDDTLVLAPDGAGGVEFRAETGGGGGVGNLWTMSKTTSQTLTSNADTVISFDRADIDGGGSVIDLANNRFVAPATGLFLAIPHWIWESTAPNGAGRAQVFVGGALAAPLVRLNGGTQGGSGSVVGTVTLSLTAGDFVTMGCHPGAAVTPTARGNASRTLSTSFTLVRIT